MFDAFAIAHFFVFFLSRSLSLDWEPRFPFLALGLDWRLGFPFLDLGLWVSIFGLRF